MHQYVSVWTPKIDEELIMIRETHNTFDIYIIAGTKLLPATIRPCVVRHLPLEI